MTVITQLLLMGKIYFNHALLSEFSETETVKLYKLFFILRFQTLRSYLMSHEPPHIQKNPPSNLNLRGMRSAPLIFFSVHVTGRRRAFDAGQPRAKINFESQRPLEEKTPRKHLYLITYQNIRVPFTDDSDQSRKEVFLFSYILYFVISDPWTR